MPKEQLYAPDLHGPGLVIRTVGARDQFPKGVVPREPRLEIQLLDCRVVEGARHDGDDVVGEAERLVEGLCDTNHLLLHGL